MATYPYVEFPAFGSTSASYLISEQPGYQSRTEGTIKAGAGKLPGGMVMAKTTDTGEYVPWVNGGTNGTGTFAGFLFQEVDARTEAVRRTITTHGLEVQRAALSFAGTPDDAAKAVAYTQMAAMRIALR